MTPDDRALVHAVDALLRQLPTDARLATLQDGFAHSGVATVARTVVVLGWAHGRYGGKTRPESERPLSDAELDAVAELARQRIQTALKDGSFWRAPHLPLLLYCWQQLGATVDEVRAAVKYGSNEGDVFLRLLMQLVQVSHSRPLGDHVSTATKTINMTTVERLMDVEETVQRASAVLSGRFSLEPAQREALELLVQAHEQRKAGTRDPEQDW